MTAILLVGFALLTLWPAYNLALVAFTASDSATAGRRRRRDAVAPNEHEPLTFWIVVPALNEERVVGRTVSAALALAGPAGTRTRVLVVDDGSDDGTPDVLAAIDHPGLTVLRRDFPNARKGKGEALNAAFRAIRDLTLLHGEDPALVAVGVIDGDGRGSANILTEVSRQMRDPRVGAVQTRVRIHNRNRVLGAVQDLEFAAIANASQLLRNAAGTVGLGGNGQFARLSSLMRLGDAPWSHCLVEDLELGLRMHLNGERIRYTSIANVNQQGLVDVKRLLRQRTRWAQGNLQCVGYVPKLVASRKIRNHALLEMLYYLLAPWMNAFGTAAVFGLWAVAMWRLLPGHGQSVLIHSWAQMGQVALFWALGMTVPGVVWALVHRVQLGDEKLWRLLVAAVAYPFFLLLGLVSTWRAIGRQISRRQAWAKTERLVEEPVLS
ncbi:glycosyltransferase family 2 protein [Dactylosporangium aurantiacum]|uniref:Glycosyltransferase family 2 protein n=1 Tax=Dactylosporangium aurantiacum TaxID=35754 RepID=A0A9Q9ML83_9ACTN|nr:glycosyltransferase family 2 protein [Dactylosporangium aurantiacum]MDG6109208.1 glycosyltransferase family 2 protein [Dactylosporangium aurantiacum]UWZ56606.1 glycosyltransferase family 2 protein [Dactylosporangium aurantiacum]